jgi:hypothetical protein
MRLADYIPQLDGEITPTQLSTAEPAKIADGAVFFGTHSLASCPDNRLRTRYRNLLQLAKIYPCVAYNVWLDVHRQVEEYGERVPRRTRGMLAFHQQLSDILLAHTNNLPRQCLTYIFRFWSEAMTDATADIDIDFFAKLSKRVHLTQANYYHLFCPMSRSDVCTANVRKLLKAIAPQLSGKTVASIINGGAIPATTARLLLPYITKRGLNSEEMQRCCTVRGLSLHEVMSSIQASP